MKQRTDFVRSNARRHLNYKKSYDNRGVHCILFQMAVGDMRVESFRRRAESKCGLVLTGRKIVRGTAVLALVEPAGPPCSGRREPHEAV